MNIVDVKLVLLEKRLSDLIFPNKDIHGFVKLTYERMGVLLKVKKDNLYYSLKGGIILDLITKGKYYFRIYVSINCHIERLTVRIFFLEIIILIILNEKAPKSKLRIVVFSKITV